MLDDLGIDDSFWIDMSFSFEDVLYIRNDVDDHGNICRDNCIIMLKGDLAISLIDIPYNEFLQKWIEYKSK
jgi:hypothetical protein